eukprot:2552707-Prymnesium_polylepis.1
MEGRVGKGPPNPRTVATARAPPPKPNSRHAHAIAGVLSVVPWNSVSHVRLRRVAVAVAEWRSGGPWNVCWLRGGARSDSGQSICPPHAEYARRPGPRS